jgi:hypothetical protein
VGGRSTWNLIREHRDESARDICNPTLTPPLKEDDYLKQISEQDRVDDKTALVIKRRQEILVRRWFRFDRAPNPKATADWVDRV